jgi:hypothetical protein
MKRKRIAAARSPFQGLPMRGFGFQGLRCASPLAIFERRIRGWKRRVATALKRE